MNSKCTRNVTRKMQMLKDVVKPTIIEHEGKRRLADINQFVMVY